MKNLNCNNNKEKNSKENGSHIQKSFNKFWISINVTILLIGLYPLINNEGEIAVHFILVMIAINIILAMLKVITGFEPEKKDKTNSIQNSTKVIEPQPRYQIGDFVRIMFVDGGCYNHSYCLQYFDKYLPDRAIHFKCDMNPENGFQGEIITFFKDYHDKYLYFIELDVKWVVLMKEECIRRINKENFLKSPNIDNVGIPVLMGVKDIHKTIVKKEDDGFSDFMTGAVVGAAVNDLFQHKNPDITSEAVRNWEDELEDINTNLDD